VTEGFNDMSDRSGFCVFGCNLPVAYRAEVDFFVFLGFRTCFRKLVAEELTLKTNFSLVEDQGSISQLFVVYCMKV